MRKSLYVILILSMLTTLVHGQALWMEPSKFVYNSGDSIRVQFKEGDDFIGRSWKQEHTRGSVENKPGLKKVEMHQQKKVIDISSYFVNDALVIPPQEEGTHVIGMQTAVMFRELDAEKFNAYLKEAALDDANYHRQKTNTLGKNGKELVTHFAKLIVQSGKRPDDTYKKETGVVIEIIPQQHPYLLKVGDRVQFKIIYEGKPLFGARVKVWNRHNNRTSVQNIFTEQNGMIETHISNPGAWMVSVVKMISFKDPQADWQSYWGSLVFGIQ